MGHRIERREEVSEVRLGEGMGKQRLGRLEVRGRKDRAAGLAFSAAATLLLPLQELLLSIFTLIISLEVLVLLILLAQGAVFLQGVGEGLGAAALVGAVATVGQLLESAVPVVLDRVGGAALELTADCRPLRNSSARRGRIAEGEERV